MIAHMKKLLILRRACMRPASSLPARFAVATALFAASAFSLHAQNPALPGAPSALPPAPAPVARVNPVTASPDVTPLQPVPAPATPAEPRKRSVAPAADQKESGDRAPSRFAEAILAEETDRDPSIAAEKYRAVVAGFDARREEAAQAIFRLGECLRKLGRIEEAKTQYARILREFVDQGELVRLSQKFLSEAPANATTQVSPPGNLDDLLRKEMGLVQEQLASVERLVSTGLASSESLLPLRRELLRLEQERALRAQQGVSNELSRVIDSRARAISAQEEDLRAIGGELRRQRLELQKLHSVKNMIEKGEPETLTASIIDDPRFLKLKAEYEDQVTNGPLRENAETAQENLKQAQRRLYRWVEQIYLPELRSSISFAENRINELEETRAALDKTIRVEQAEHVKAGKGERVGGILRPGEPARR